MFVDGHVGVSVVRGLLRGGRLRHLQNQFDTKNALQHASISEILFSSTGTRVAFVLHLFPFLPGICIALCGAVLYIEVILAVVIVFLLTLHVDPHH